jgi:tetratricopeptide (TPR) repeat protein
MRKSALITAFLILVHAFSHAQEPTKHTAQYYFEKGEQSLAKKEYISAQAHFNECLRLDPHYAEAYRLRAITREHLGEKARALTDYNVYVDLKPTNSEGLFSRAVLRFEAKQYLLARQDFLNLLKLPPGETNTVYFSQEKYTDANGKVFTVQSSSRDYLYNYLGVIETKLSRYPQAIGWLDSAIHVSPGNSSFWINRGMAKQEAKDNAGAAADYEQALKLEPDNALALHNLATLKEEKYGDEKEKLLTAAIEKNRNLPYPRSARGYYRLQKNDYKGALEDYSEAIKLEPKDEENYINRGLAREKMNDLDGALTDYSAVIKLNDKNEKAWMCHGIILSKQRKWTEAIEDFNVAITLNPKYGLALYNRSIAYQSTGKSKEACNDLKVAEKLGVIADEKVKAKICK